MSELRVNGVTSLGGTIPDGVGRIVQIVRATDSTQRSTTSSSFVDANVSVTITPTLTTSTILLIWAVQAQLDISAAGGDAALQITDSSDVALSGAEDAKYQISAAGATYVAFKGAQTLFAWDSPATTSATTYKGRFRRVATSITARLYNDERTGQLFAIEVAA